MNDSQLAALDGHYQFVNTVEQEAARNWNEQQHMRYTIVHQQPLYVDAEHHQQDTTSAPYISAQNIEQGEQSLTSSAVPLHVHIPDFIVLEKRLVAIEAHTARSERSTNDRRRATYNTSMRKLERSVKEFEAKLERVKVSTHNNAYGCSIHL